MSILTKVFIVLQLVCSLVLAVMVVVVVHGQENYKNQVKSLVVGQDALAAALQQATNKGDAVQAKYDAQVSSSGTAITTWKSKVEALQGENAGLKTQVDTLTGQSSSQLDSNKALAETVNSLKEQLKAKDDELTSIRPKIVELIAKNAELNRINNELQTKVDFATKAIRTLQEALAAASEKAGSVVPASSGDSKVTQGAVQTPVQINGKVASVTTDNGRTYIELGLGARDGVKLNAQFAVYRGSSYVGDAVVSRVVPDQCVALMTVVKPGETVKAGDVAISGSAQ